MGAPAARMTDQVLHTAPHCHAPIKKTGAIQSDLTAWSVSDNFRSVKSQNCEWLLKESRDGTSQSSRSAGGG